MMKQTKDYNIARFGVKKVNTQKDIDFELKREYSSKLAQNNC